VTAPEAIWLIGAGGHGKVAAAAARAAGFRIGGVFDDDIGARGKILLGVPARSPVPIDSPEGVAHVAVGSNEARKRIVTAHISWRWVSIRHPAAWADRSAVVGSGSLICACARIQIDTTIGAHTIIGTGAIVNHDCRIGDYCLIASGAVLAGAVVVGEGALVGVGSCVAPGVRIGTWAVVGAGAVVVRDVLPGVTVVGNPARQMADAPRASAFGDGF